MGILAQLFNLDISTYFFSGELIVKNANCMDVLKIKFVSKGWRDYKYVFQAKCLFEPTYFSRDMYMFGYANCCFFTSSSTNEFRIISNRIPQYLLFFVYFILSIFTLVLKVYKHARLSYPVFRLIICYLRSYFFSSLLYSCFINNFHVDE